MLKSPYISRKEFLMNNSTSVFRTTVIFILCLLTSLIFITSSILADQEIPTTEANPKTTETVIPPETILASFGEQTITLGQFNQLWEQIPENYKSQLTKSNVLDQMISEKLLIQEAKNIGLEKDKDVLEQIKKISEQILVQAFLQKEILDKIQVNDGEVEEYYKKNQDKFTEKEQVHLFNILVETEEKAQEILTELKTGKDFSEIAKENSIGPSASQGGDLGYLSKGTIIPEIEDIVFALEVGELSQVVKTNFGFHVLKITDKKPERVKTLEEVKEDIRQTLLSDKQKEAFDNLIEELKSKVEIQINEEALK